jgi:hypothetical protein
VNAKLVIAGAEVMTKAKQSCRTLTAASPGKIGRHAMRRAFLPIVRGVEEAIPARIRFSSVGTALPCLSGGLRLSGAKAIMIVDIKDVRSIGLGERRMPFDNHKVFIIRVRRLVTEVMAAEGDNAFFRIHRIDHQHLVVDDRPTERQGLVIL